MIEYICEFSDHPNINDKGALREKVVRCRDCVHFDGIMMCSADAYTRIEPDCSGEMREVIEGLRFVRLNGFCAWGAKRKEGGE